MLPETGIHPLTLAVSLHINSVVEKLKAARVRVECRGRGWSQHCCMLMRQCHVHIRYTAEAGPQTMRMK